MSNFNKVKEFMTTFGQDTPSTPQLDAIKEPDGSLKTFRLSLIQEEVKELEEAMNAGDVVEVVDALADILYVTYGAGAAFGVDMDKVFDMVHNSNMTKACSSMDEAEETQKWYLDHPEKGYKTPIIEKKGNLFLIKNEDTKKVLKNVNYEAVTENLKKFLL